MSAPDVDGAILPQRELRFFGIAIPSLIRFAEGLEGQFERATPLFLWLARALEEIGRSPAIEGYEAFLIDQGRDPFESRFLARVLIKCGAESCREQAAERKLRSAIGRLVKCRDGSPLVISRRAKSLRVALNEPAVEAPLHKALATAGYPEAIYALKELIDRAVDRDTAAHRLLIEISEALHPHLANPRGRAPTVAGATHELLLDLLKRSFTYDPVEGDLTDGATRATRTAMNRPNFDSRPACRRRKRKREE